MAELITLGATLLAAIQPVVEILKRHYSVENASLASRQRVARELRDACEAWSSLLQEVFEKAIDLLESQGARASLAEIERQQSDFGALDYLALEHRSEALAGLRADVRFSAFADSCASFYREAIRTKDMAYRTFEQDGVPVSLDTDGIGKVGRLWKRRVESALNDVRSEYRKVERLNQS